MIKLLPLLLLLGCSNPTIVEPKPEPIPAPVVVKHHERKACMEGTRAWPKRNNPYEDRMEHEAWQKGFDWMTVVSDRPTNYYGPSPPCPCGQYEGDE